MGISIRSVLVLLAFTMLLGGCAGVGCGFAGGGSSSRNANGGGGCHVGTSF